MDPIKHAAFAATTDHLSLWEVAHRWAGYAAHDSEPNRIPTPVRDVLFAMMRAQLASRLRVLSARGHTYKDWTYLREEDFDPEFFTKLLRLPSDDPTCDSEPAPAEPLEDWTPDSSELPYGMEEEEKWDGTEDHRRELYLDYMHRKLRCHDEAIHDHADILDGEKPINRDYLKSVHVSQTDLAIWAMEEGLPFPDFWFTPAQRQELENLLQPTEEKEEQSEKGQETEQERETEIDAPGRLTGSQIDRFWARLAPKQRHRILCREVAEVLWKENPSMTAREIVKHDTIQRYCGGKYYTSKDTIPSWVRDLDPRPVEKKTGRKQSS